MKEARIISARYAEEQSLTTRRLSFVFVPSVRGITNIVRSISLRISIGKEVRAFPLVLGEFENGRLRHLPFFQVWLAERAAR